MDKEQITQLSERWAEAERKMDSDSLAQLVDGEFTMVGPRGFILTRDQWVNRYRSNDLKNESFTWKVEDVKEFDCYALVHGVQTQKTTYQGRDSSGSFRVTLVEMKNSKDWHIAHIQLSGPMMEMGQR